MKIIGSEQTVKKVNASRVTIWRWERDGLFPARVQLGPRRVGWYEDEIDEWLKSRPRVNGENGGGK